MQDIDSATSVATEGTLEQIRKLNNLPEEVLDIVTKPLYHVVFDMDFGAFLRDKSAYVLNADSKGTRRMPVLFDLNLARKVAGEFIARAISEGGLGDKKYPLYGAVIFGMKFTDCDHVKCEDLSYDINSKSSDKDITTYNIEHNGENVKQGSVSFESLRRLCVVSAEYVVRNDLQPANGFALLNLCENLTSSDIKMLKQMVNDPDKQVELKLCGQTVVVDTQNGTRDMQNAARQEKAHHIALQQRIQQNPSTHASMPSMQSSMPSMQSSMPAMHASMRASMPVMQESHLSMQEARQVMQQNPLTQASRSSMQVSRHQMEQNPLQESRSTMQVSRRHQIQQNPLQESRSTTQQNPLQESRSTIQQNLFSSQPMVQQNSMAHSLRTVAQMNPTQSENLHEQVKNSIMNVDQPSHVDLDKSKNIFQQKTRTQREDVHVPSDIQAIVDNIHHENNTNMIGGRIDYTTLWKQKKAEYKKMKAQQGGGGNLDYEALCKQMKAEYKQMKANTTH
ncbi:hypothetical protein BMW23_0239 [Bodo saltans virus]|uniref:Uncharacterized protein n=1 Tax=Bodo saltans virus TaxID=2024608 RepID=A0A2H4UTX2_9VIRU|nr:hypothetical protein QJ851_gp0234 [Bodo saltans virus]ATZ80297.1 hypothetical protein BMW23_0239 [Bodo saltans virus]